MGVSPGFVLCIAVASSECCALVSEKPKDSKPLCDLITEVETKMELQPVSAPLPQFHPTRRLLCLVLRRAGLPPRIALEFASEKTLQQNEAQQVFSILKNYVIP